MTEAMLTSPEELTVHLTETSVESLFSATAHLGITRDEAMNYAIQLLAQVIAGKRGQLLTVKTVGDMERTVHFH